MNYDELKSGTDVRGTALDIKGGKVNLTLSAVRDIAAAFGVFLKARNPKASVIAVGGDSRLSTPDIRDTVAKTLAGEGYDVLDAIAETRTDYSDRPYDEQRIKSMTVETFGVEYPAPEK